MSTPEPHVGPGCENDCQHVIDPTADLDLFNSVSVPATAAKYQTCWGILRAICKLLSKLGEDAILKDKVLRNKLLETWKARRGDIIREHVYYTLAPRKDAEIVREVQPMNKQETFDAFQHTYLGDSPDLLIEIMDEYRRNKPQDKMHNYSISMVQSSGTGKSRLVELIAQKRFTFLFNLREDLKPDQYTYPLPDQCVRKFFCKSSSDRLRTWAYTVFLTELFKTALRFVKDTSRAIDGPESLAHRWYTYLQQGATSDAPGEQRSKIYKHAVNSADKYMTDTSETDTNTLAGAQRDLASASRELSRAINRTVAPPASNSGSLADSASNSNSLIDSASDSGIRLVLVFDEAHTLTQSSDSNDLASSSAYAILGRVLTFLKPFPIFTIFLSTNSNVQALAPSADMHPSIRAREGNILFPPFVELPFDLFVDFTGSVNLYRACSARMVLKFGRPLWWTLFCQSRDDQEGIGRVKSLAIQKLNPVGPTSTAGRDAMIACLSIRLMMDFGSSVQVLPLQSRLVESHMRIIFSVPEHRQYMHTGTPSEPILAEAAASYMASVPDQVVPTLAHLFQDGFLAKGERGELVTRLLWIQAYDRALKTAAERRRSASPPERDPWQFTYIRPVAVIDFLKALFHEDWHDIVLNARSVGSWPDDSPDLTLKEVFRDAYLNFSHFVRAGDFKVIRHHHLYKFLLRHCAVQCRDNQQAVDGGAPMHWEKLGTIHVTPISQDNTSSILHLTKDREEGNFSTISPTLFQTTATKQLPTLAIFHDHGIKEKEVSIHHQPSKEMRNGRRLYQNHFQINVAGLGSDIYGVVTQQDEQHYNTLLSMNKLALDFPRFQNDRARRAFESLKPCITVESGSVRWEEAAMDTSP